MKSLTDDKGLDVTNALIRLENNADFALFKTWLGASYEDIKGQLIDTRGENTLLAQGYADALRDITESVNDPRRFHIIAKARANRVEIANNLSKATEW